jgi:hypothetical protein
MMEAAMRTTLTVRDDIMRELMKITEAKTQTEAVNRAVADWVRRMKVLRIKSLRGKLIIDGDLDKLRARDIAEVGDE